MPQEMSFAQALNEARQIIVQQSNRIKGDLDRIKTLQDNINTLTGTIGESDRQLREKNTALETAAEQLKAMTTKADEARVAKEQGEAVIDRQGQRLTQMQDTIAGLEKHLAEMTQKHDDLHHELESIRSAVPTQEDTEALAALASLLSAKKGAPAAPKPPELQDTAVAA